MKEPEVFNIKNCEVCGNKGINSILDLGLHPLCDDLVPLEDTRICLEYPIDIAFCNQCYTAHQLYQVPKRELFTADYHYRARMTGSVLEGMSDLVDSIEKRSGSLSNKKVLDIGCNDGSLLDFFKKKGAETFGIEPTGAAKDSNHKTLNAFFDKENAEVILKDFGKPDFITFTNVFAHIEDLPGLLENLKLLMHEESILVIENHYLGAVFRTGQFDTFYHEHPRTYSKRSFEYIAKSLSLNLLDVEFVSRYGGNIRAYIGNGEEKFVEVDESHFAEGLRKMNSDVEEWKGEMLKIITNYVDKYGKLRAKAFPGRSAILIKLLGLDENHISAVYEIKGSKKVGHYIPGTRIPIKPESDLYNEINQTLPILNLAWHIPSEVRENLSNNGYIGEVLDIKSINE